MVMFIMGYIQFSKLLPRAHSWRQLEVQVREEIELELGVMIHILEHL
jgi:hypothetical protein